MKNIEFTDFDDLEDVKIELDDVLNLLSILHENVFCNDEIALPQYFAQFVSVNKAAIVQLRNNQEKIQNVFNTLYTKINSSKQESDENV